MEQSHFEVYLVVVVDLAIISHYHDQQTGFVSCLIIVNVNIYIFQYQD